MTSTSYFVLFAGIINLAISFMLGKYQKTPLQFILLWWFVWLFISTLSLTGIYVPSSQTCDLFIIMLSAMTVGGVIFCLSKNKKSYLTQARDLVFSEDEKFKQKLLLRIIYFLVLPIVLFFFQKALVIFLFNPQALASYRVDVFAENILFPNPLIYYLYWLVISPIILFSLLSGLAIFILHNRLHLLLISSVCYVMEAIFFLGRFNFYVIVVVFLVALLYKFRFKLSTLLRRREFYSTLLAIATVIGLFVYVTNARYTPNARVPTSPTSSSNSVIDELILYHTAGFTIFDLHLNSPNFILGQEPTLGRACLGVFERMTVIILRVFNGEIFSIPEKMGGELNRFLVLGRDNNGNPISGNAFGTVLYPIYADGRLIFTFILPALYGFYLLKFTSLAFRHPNVFNLIIMFLLIYLGFFGLFQAIITETYWLYFVYAKLLFGLKPINRKLITPEAGLLSKLE